MRFRQRLSTTALIILSGSVLFAACRPRTQDADVLDNGPEREDAAARAADRPVDGVASGARADLRDDARWGNEVSSPSYDGSTAGTGPDEPVEATPIPRDAADATVPVPADVLVYGGTAAGVMAAIQAARMGGRVILVAPERHLGGMSVEGLGSADIDKNGISNSAAFGGLARELHERIGRRYGRNVPVYRFESRVAEAAVDEMLAAVPVRVLRGARLAEGADAVQKDGARVVSLRTTDGAVFEARVFVDASIEADLLAAAGVSTVVGREPNSLYGETKNGIRGDNTYRQFTVRVDPYRIPGDPRSGLIPTIQNELLGTPGAGDERIQGYCFRICLTQEPGNQVPFAQPPGYDRGQYEIYLRYLAAGGTLFSPSAGLPRGKTDLGGWHDLSINLYGMNHAYPRGNHATRERIYDEHRRFTAGLFHFLANDPQVPDRVRSRWRPWGLCKDEFTDNGGWPRLLYVRDARRMVSDYVVTEHHTRRVRPTPVPDPVAVAYWPPDTHHVRRIVRDGAAYNEGFVYGGDDWGPFGVSWRVLYPRAAEATNLLAPSAPSSSHVAYGAIRLEWTFMALGQAAGTAAMLAARDGRVVQEVDYTELARRLRADGQVLSLEGR